MVSLFSSIWFMLSGRNLLCSVFDRFKEKDIVRSQYFSFEHIITIWHWSWKWPFSSLSHWSWKLSDRLSAQENIVIIPPTFAPPLPYLAIAPPSSALASPFPIVHVRYFKILTWLWGFLVIFLYLVGCPLCSSLQFWELRDNGVEKNLQFWPQSLGVMLEF